ncbi:MAG: hypothetical protein H6625_04115 [Bdellovibrionaceae bacterium]|nr:hypothetical protein [Pseudobdellovibrionaceae bacterium]
MKLYTTLLLILIIPLKTRAFFSELSPNVNLQYTEIIKPLRDFFLMIKEEAITIDYLNQQWVVNASVVLPQCKSMTLSWHSKKTKNDLKDQLVLQCDNSQSYEIILIRSGKNIQAYGINDWLELPTPDFSSLDSFKMYLSWTDFKFDYQNKRRELQLHLLGSYGPKLPFEFLFTETVNTKYNRFYHIKSSEFDVFVEENSRAVSPGLYNHEFFSSDEKKEISPLIFSYYIKSYLNILANSLILPFH